MSYPRHNVARWFVPALVILAAVAVGWYLGSQAGSDSGESPDSNSPFPTGTDEDSGSQDGGEVYRDVAGRVVRVDAEQGVLRVDHEEIEGFMRAMVMDLNVADPEELEGLEPDDAILFDLVRIGETYEVVNIRRQSDEDADPADGEVSVEPPDDPLERGDLVPDLTLVDASGEAFQLHEMEPRHKLVTFFYVRCPLETFCPAQSERLAELQSHIEDAEADLHLVSLTLDSEHDNPEILAGYADQFDADPTLWTLARSEDADAVRRFAHRAGARINQHADSYEIDHALIALRLDGNRIVDQVYGLDSMEQLVHQMP